MRTLEVGVPVQRLWFLPDGERLLVGCYPLVGEPHGLILWPFDGRETVRLIPPDGSPIGCTGRTPGHLALHPTRPLCIVARGTHVIAFDTGDGGDRSQEFPERFQATQVIVSRDGRRMLSYAFGSAIAGWSFLDEGPRLEWEVRLSARLWWIVGFLDDGDGIVTTQGPEIEVLSYDDGSTRATARVASAQLLQATISGDGRVLGIKDAAALWLFDLPGLDNPRSLGGPWNRDGRDSFAFLPDGRTVAVIRGDRTRVALHDRETLEPVDELDWGFGPLNWVEFSPDGMLGAAASESGKVVVWDVI